MKETDKKAMEMVSQQLAKISVARRERAEVLRQIKEKYENLDPLRFCFSKEDAERFEEIGELIALLQASEE